jgi:hypothetical protein
VLFRSQRCNTFYIDNKGIKWFLGTYIAKYDGITLDTISSFCPAVHDVLADNQGGFLLASDSGLARFDGSSLIFGKYCRANSGIVSDMARCLHRDEEGNVWIGTTEGLSCLKGNMWTSLTAGNSLLPSNNVLCITSDGLGNAYFGTDRGIAIYRQGGLVSTETMPEKSLNIINAHPNPFNGQMDISLSNTPEGFMSISIYDITGRKIRTLLEGESPGASSTISWDGKDEQGRRVNSGIYVVTAACKSGLLCRKVVRY